MAVWGVMQEREMCLDFAVMPYLQLFHSLAGGIVEILSIVRAES